jgi:hypothetical protein
MIGKLTFHWARGQRQSANEEAEQLFSEEATD